MVKVILGGMAPGNLPAHELDEVEAAYKRKAKTGGPDDDISDLIPEATSDEEKWKKFHGKYYGRAR